MEHYTPGCSGWVIRDAIAASPHLKPGTVHVSWWYGPDHGWGVTYGTLSYSVAVFPTRKAAEQAYQSVYVTDGTMRRGRGRAQRVADAEAEAQTTRSGS